MHALKGPLYGGGSRIRSRGATKVLPPVPKFLTFKIVFG
jgi:hypothetical protein